MKKLLVAFLIVLTSCAIAQTYDLKIPGKVAVKKTDKHVQFLSTRVFIAKPEGYEADSTFLRFQKDDSTYIESFMFEQHGFTEIKKELKQNIKKNKTDYFKLYYYKEFKLGAYDALIDFQTVEGKINMDEINIFYGNKDFFASIRGVFKHTDELAKQEILAALLTTYIDTAAKSDASAFLPFMVDLSQSKFKLNNSINQIFYYTIGGLGGSVLDPFINSFYIIVLPAFNDIEAIKKQSQAMIAQYKVAGKTVTNYEEKELLINDNKAYEIACTTTNMGKPLQVYQVVLGGSTISLLFRGTAISDFETMSQEFKNAVRTIKIK